MRVGSFGRRGHSFLKQYLRIGACCRLRLLPLAGSTALTSLCWELARSAHHKPEISLISLGDLRLPRLRSLRLEAEWGLQFRLRPQFSCLPELRTLAIGTDCSLRLSWRCLPRGLTRLDLSALSADSVRLHGPLSCARRLRRLCLRVPGLPAAGLQRLAGLTRLELQTAEGELNLGQVSPLTSLKALTLHAAQGDGPEDWSALLPLTRLSVLVLRDCCSLEHAVPMLDQLPGLRRLVIEPAGEVSPVLTG